VAEGLSYHGPWVLARGIVPSPGGNMGRQLAASASIPDGWDFVKRKTAPCIRFGLPEGGGPHLVVDIHLQIGYHRELR